jgi:hypothetical protein
MICIIRLWNVSNVLARFYGVLVQRIRIVQFDTFDFNIVAQDLQDWVTDCVFFS